MREASHIFFSLSYRAHIIVHTLLDLLTVHKPISKMGPKAKKTEKSEGKAKADKPKTKRAPSPYIIFCQEKRPELRAAHPNATFGEMGKMLGQMWAQMDEKAKAVSFNLL
jgi:hypothetical protein